MKLEKPIALFNLGTKKKLVLLLMAVLFGMSALLANAQSMIAPASPSVPVETMDQQSEVNEFDVFPPQGTEQAGAHQPFQAGPFIARPHISYQFLYGSGIQSSPGDQQDTIIQTLSPGVLFELGRHWSLDYTPTLRFYSDSHFKNEFDNSVSLVGSTTYENWTLGLSQSFNESSSPEVETAAQTDQQNYSTTISASYTFNDKISLDMSANQTLTYVDNPFGTNNFNTNNPSANQNLNQDSMSWSTTEFINYNFWPRFNVGVGGTLGYVNVNIGPNQTFEDLNGRFNWRATDKISLQINGGMEFVQFSGGGELGAGESDLATPIFSVSIQYQPFKNTQISLSGSRAVSPSSFFILDSVTETTSVTLGVSQRLLTKYSLSLSGGYTKTDYTQSFQFGGMSIPLSDRTDNSWNFNAQLSRAIWKRGTIAATYTYSTDSSSQPGFGYSSNQIGIQFSYNY
jgi:hypothetical protein